MKKYLILSLVLASVSTNCYATDFGKISPINPLDGNPSTYQESVNVPSFEMKKVH